MKDDFGVFFVYDYTNNFNVAHATQKDFPGHDKTKYQDSQGMDVIQELSKIAKRRRAAALLCTTGITRRQRKKRRSWVMWK